MTRQGYGVENHWILSRGASVFLHVGRLYLKVPSIAEKGPRAEGIKSGGKCQE